MLRKMILQGLIAAGLIAGASSFYAATAGADFGAALSDYDQERGNDHDDD